MRILLWISFKTIWKKVNFIIIINVINELIIESKRNKAAQVPFQKNKTNNNNKEIPLKESHLIEKTANPVFSEIDALCKKLFKTNPIWETKKKAKGSFIKKIQCKNK